MKLRSSGRSIVEIGRATPSTLVILPEGDLSSFKATGRTGVVVTGQDGKPVTLGFVWVIQRKRGWSVPVFDPETALYFTPDHVDNVASENDLRREGGLTSAARLLDPECAHSWKKPMSFDVMLKHAHNSPLRAKTPVSREEIICSYNLLRVAEEIS